MNCANRLIPCIFKALFYVKLGISFLLFKISLNPTIKIYDAIKVQLLLRHLLMASNNI